MRRWPWKSFSDVFFRIVYFKLGTHSFCVSSRGQAITTWILFLPLSLLSLDVFCFDSILSNNILSPTHYGPEQPRIHTEVLDHSLVCSLVCLHRSLVRLLHPAHFAHSLASLIFSRASLTQSLALYCLLCSRAPRRSLVPSLTHFTHSLARGTLND